MNDYDDDFLLCIRNNDGDGMWRCYKTLFENNFSSADKLHNNIFPLFLNLKK